jgi:predicted RNase H-like HicB family nuclease
MEKYHITLVESPEGWAVWCDDLPGCASQGETREEALENIRIAIREVLEVQAELRAAQEADLRNEGLRVEHMELSYA